MKAIMLCVMLAGSAFGCMGNCPGNPDRYTSVGLNVDYTETSGQKIGPPGYNMQRTITHRANYQTIVYGDLRLPISRQDTLTIKAGRALHHTEPSVVSEDGWTLGAGLRRYFRP